MISMSIDKYDILESGLSGFGCFAWKGSTLLGRRIMQNIRIQDIDTFIYQPT